MKRLLFILNHSDLTGVNTFNYTVIDAVLKNYNNYQIDVFLLNSENSIFASFLPVSVRIVSEIRDIYDIAYFNYEENNEYFDILKGADKKFFVHGLMVENNLPKCKYNKVYCFGERSFFYVNAENKQLIRNYIDCNRFYYTPPSRKLEKVLIHSSRDSQILLSTISTAVSHINGFTGFTGSNFLNVGKDWFIEKKIQNADLIIGYGRCVIEAMAMGRAVIVFGLNGGDGFVDAINFWKLAETNFSGWSLKSLLFNINKQSVNQLVNEFFKYNTKDIHDNYSFVKEYFDINKHIDKLL